MKRGDTYCLRRFVSGRPSMATIVSNPEDDYLITMEGVCENTGKKIRFTENLCHFKGRWIQQLNLFDSKPRSKMSKKYLK